MGLNCENNLTAVRLINRRESSHSLTSDSLKLFAQLFIIIIAIFMIFFYIFIVVVEPALFYFTPEGVNATTTTFSNPLIIWIINIPIGVYTGLNLGAIFFGLWVVFAVSFAAAWKLRKAFQQLPLLDAHTKQHDVNRCNNNPKHPRNGRNSNWNCPLTGRCLPGSF